MRALTAAGYEVETRDVGRGRAALRALRGGAIDAYAEYTGAALTELYGLGDADVPRDAARAYADVRRRLAGDGVTALPQAPYDGTTAVVATRRAGAGLATALSKLRSRAGRLVATGPRACPREPGCLPAARRVYGLRFERFTPSPSPLAALAARRADVAFVAATDARLVSDRYVLIADDRHAFPPQHVTLLVRTGVLGGLGRDAPRVVEAVQRNLTEAVMRELNSRVELKSHRPDRVAADYLREAGFTAP